MIASFAHNFIFIKTRKTAGTSIELALSSLCGERDIITPVSFDDEKMRRANGWRGPQNFSNDPKVVNLYRELLEHGSEVQYRELNSGAKRRNDYYNHMPSKMVRRMLGQEFWGRALKWTIERHPYERAVSSAYFRISHDGLPPERFQDVLNEAIDNGRINQRNLYMIDGKLAVDVLVRYEDLPGALNSVLAKSGLRFGDALPQAKTTQRRDRRPAREILNKRQKEAIYASCQETFKLLEYEA